MYFLFSYIYNSILYMYMYISSGREHQDNELQKTEFEGTPWCKQTLSRRQTKVQRSCSAPPYAFLFEMPQRHLIIFLWL